METATQIYDRIDEDIKKRIKSSPELAATINALDDEQMKQFRERVYGEYLKRPENQLVFEEEKKLPAPTFYGFGGAAVQAPFAATQPAKTRRLRSRAAEAVYEGYKSALLGGGEEPAETDIPPLESLSSEQRKELLAMAEEEGREDIAPFFKFDGRYLKHYYDILDSAVEVARQKQADTDSWRNSVLVEFGRGLIEQTANLGAAAGNLYRRLRGGVPFGNPDNLTPKQIYERAYDDAMGQVAPYFLGTKDFPDIREKASIWRKLARGAGDLASYAKFTPQSILFKEGAKAGGKLAAMAGVEKLARGRGLANAMAHMAAGSAAASPVVSLAEVRAPADKQTLGETLGNAAIEAAASIPSGAAMGAGLYGFGKAAMALKKHNPIYKTVLNNEAEDFSRFVATLSARRKNGVQLSKDEAEFLDNVARRAKQDGVKPADVLSGKIGVEYFAQSLRPWVGKIPVAGKILPQERLGWKYRNTPDAVPAGESGEPFDAESFTKNADEAVAAANAQPPKEVLPLGHKTPEDLSAEVNAEGKFSREEPFGGGEKLPLKFADKDAFTDYVLSNDESANRIYDYLKYTENRREVWNADYLPLFAKKYNAKVNGINLTDRAFTRRKLAEDAQKLIDSIPDAEVDDKLAVIESTKPAYLSNDHLQFAVDQGQIWAKMELDSRLAAEATAEAQATADNIFKRLADEGLKLPTPKAMRENGGELSAEMERVYNSLPADVRMKYFSRDYTPTDELAQLLGYENKSALFSAADNGVRAINEKRLNPIFDDSTPVLPHGLKARKAQPRAAQAPVDDFAEPPESYKTYELRPFEHAQAKDFVPEERVKFDTERARKLENAKAELLLSPREWRESVFPNLTDKAIEAAKRGMENKVGERLQGFEGEDTRLFAYKNGVFRVAKGGETLKKFPNEDSARAFVDEWNDKAAEIVQSLNQAQLEAFGAGGSSKRFIELATKDTRVQGVRMFVPRTVEGAKKIYNEALEHHKSMRSLDAVFEAELSKRDFKTEEEFAEWLRDNSTEVDRNLKRIGDEYLEEVGGEKWDIDDAELERRENLWLKNNLSDLQRLYGAKIETPAPTKPAGEYGAEGNGGSFNSRSNLSQSMKEVRAQYTNADKTMRLDYMRAPNGNATNLTEVQWLQFRTPEFKEKYGDWETLARINEVSKMPAKEIEPHESLDKGQIKEVFKSFGVVKNEHDGRSVIFPSASAGKIKYHKGFDSSTIIGEFKSLFESSMPIFSEKEIFKVGHKQHRSYESYEHYVNKFTANGNEYFVRFTVPVIKNNTGSNNVHSAAISEVAVYKNERASSVVSAYNNAQGDVSISGKGGSSQFVDGKLLDFLSSVKKKDIKIPLDENGEPIPEVFQTDGEFGAEGYEGAKASFTPYGKTDPIGRRIGTVDPQGRFAPERFAPASQTHATDAVEAYRKLNDMVKVADDINGGTPPELAAKLGSQIELWKTKLDPKMLNLPDLVELANSLMTQPVGVRRRMGRALGVFEHSPYSSTIKIRTDMFEWVNDAERFALAERAADRTLERIGHAEFISQGHTLNEKLDLIERESAKSAFADVYESFKKDYSTKKKQEGGFTSSATAVLAHEIGHLIDYIPDGIVRGRGNILGHIGVLWDFHKKTLPITKNGVQLTEAKRNELRQTARQNAAVEFGNPDLADYFKSLKTTDKATRDAYGERVKELYKMLVDEYCQKNNILDFDTARNELKNVMAWWQGVPVEKLPKYFTEKPQEMYAESFSAFLGNPAKFAELAPNVSKAMFMRMRAKPQVWDSWQQFQLKQNDPSARAEDFINMMKRSFDNAQRRNTEIKTAVEAERKKLGAIRWKTTLTSEHQPIYDIAKKIAKEAGIAREDVTQMIDRDRYRMSQVEEYATEFKNRVYDTIRDGGITTEQVGTFMAMRRIITERADIANPHGLQPSDAKRVIDHMLATMSKPQKKALLKAVRELHGIRKRLIIDPLKELGCFSPELTAKIADNLDYATFTASKDIQLRAGIDTLLHSKFGESGATIYKQTGNLGDIENPLGATIQKDASLILFINRQRATGEFIRTMRRGAPELIQPAETRFDKNTNTHVPVERETAENTTIKFLENGKVKGYYVPKVYAEAFKTHDAGQVERGLRKFNGFFKGLFTQYNPLFWAKGAVRDVRTMLEKLPAPEEMGAFKGRLFVLKELAREYPKAFRESFRALFGKTSNQTLEALHRGVIVSKAEWMGDRAGDDAVQQLMRKYSLTPEGLSNAPKTRAQAAKDVLARVWLTFGNMGQVSERAAKLASLKYVDKNFTQMSEAVKTQIVREVGGSPDFNNRPSRASNAWLDLAFLYYTPRIRGLEATAHAYARNPKQAAAGILMYSLPNAALKWAIRLGEFEIVKSAFESVLPKEWAENMTAALAQTSEQERMMYDIWPLPFKIGGKHYCIYIPKEDTTRYIVSAFDALIRLEPLKGLQQIAKNELLSFSPVVETGVNWIKWGAGENPNDSRGRPIIPEDEHLTSHYGWGAWEMGKYTYNQSLGSILPKFTRSGDTPQNAFDHVLNFPLLKPLLGNFIREPRGGGFEVLKDAETAYRTEQARERLKRNDVVGALARGENLSDAQLDTLRKNIDDSRGFGTIAKQVNYQNLRQTDPYIAEVFRTNDKTLAMRKLQALYKRGIIGAEKFRIWSQFILEDKK